MADEIRELAACGEDLVQAPVSASNPTTFTLTFFGNLTADLSGGGVDFRDAGGNPITRTQFFAALGPSRPGQAGSLIRVRGAFTAGVLIASEASLTQ